EGDACNMANIADAQVDLVITIFGAMFAPRPTDVAKELVRVTKKGGKIIMGNWIPGHQSLVSQVLRISAKYVPPPPEGTIPPISWGVEANVLERFAAAGIPKESISFAHEPYDLISPHSAKQMLAEFRDYY